MTKTVKLTKWDFVVHPRSRREFYFLRGKLQSAKSLWRKNARKLGY